MISIRDDLSTDTTRIIIENYRKTYPDRINILDSGENLGTARSFGVLMGNSTGDFIVFCDQDDIWDTNKLREFDNFINENSLECNNPLIIYSDASIINENGNFLEDSHYKSQNLYLSDRNILKRILVQNVITGCTMVISKDLKEKSLPIPAGVIMHDWYLAICAAAFGNIYYLDIPLVGYRKHGKNVIGSRKHGKLGMEYLVDRILRGMEYNVNSVNKLRTQINSLKYNPLLENISEIREIQSIFRNRVKVFRVYLLIRRGYLKKGLIRNVGFLVFA